MTFFSEDDREAFISFLMTEIEADNDNLDSFYPLVGTMSNKTSENRLGSTIKRFAKSIEKNEKLIAEAVEARISVIATPLAHMADYKPNYEVFKG